MINLATDTEIQLRSYQLEAINSIFKYYLDGNTGHPLIVAPTGSGKSFILGGIIKRFRDTWPNIKILVVSHTKEILQQDYNAICKFVPEELVSIYSSGLKSKEKNQYTIAGIQSIWRKSWEFKDYQLVIVDEAHLIPPKGEGRYRTLFNYLDTAKIIGLTATPFRLGHGYLTDNHLFDKIVYDIDILQLIKKSYLCNLTAKDPGYNIDVSKVKVVGGDFVKKQLSAEVNITSVTNSIINKLLSYKDIRKKWLVFAIDIDHAESVGQALNNAGIKTGIVHSKLDFDRSYIIDLFRKNYIQALVNVETLTTGFDVPDIDMIVLMRPTQSPVLHVQMIGRGMRVAPDKDNCLVLDFAGNLKRLGPINDPTVKSKNTSLNKQSTTLAAKTCPECAELVGLKTKICPSCGYEFPKQIKLETKSSEVSPIKTKPLVKLEEFKVDSVTYSIHFGKSNKPSLKVTYRSGLKTINEWIGFEHQGFPHYKAKVWWRQRSLFALPKTVQEAYDKRAGLLTPKSIHIDTSGKYDQILRYNF